MSFLSVLKKSAGDGSAVLPGTSTVNGSGVLCINCRGCDRSPDFCDYSCVRCISSSVIREGATDRIRLTSVRDLEVSGDIAVLICDIAHLLSPCVCDPADSRCDECERRPTVVMDAVSNAFPEVPFAELKASVRFSPGDDPDCAACLQRTLALLNRSESELAGIRSSASDMAGVSR